MALNMIYPPYEVVRNLDRCTNCRVCERQCANGVHRYDAPTCRPSWSSPPPSCFPP